MATGKTPLEVSIHTLHELEARKPGQKLRASASGFPFIRFTNWKQEIGAQITQLITAPFPFIRFTNWKQVSAKRRQESVLDRFHSYASRIGSKKRKRLPSLSEKNVSIHTLHELEASSWYASHDQKL